MWKKKEEKDNKIEIVLGQIFIRIKHDLEELNKISNMPGFEEQNQESIDIITNVMQNALRVISKTKSIRNDTWWEKNIINNLDKIIKDKDISTKKDKVDLIIVNFLRKYPEL
ncbi:MAG: hypothetical protein ACOCRX_11510, partial [Candidatus Woesearchaeota archaeon]